MTNKSVVEYITTNFPDLGIYIIIIIFSFPFIKWIVSLKIDKHRLKLEQIKAAQLTFKNNLIKPSKKQRFLTEQLFENMYKYRFEYSEIVALLNTNSPTIAVSLYVKGADFLKLSKSRKTIILKEDYKFIKLFGKKYYRIGIKSFFKYFFFAGVSLALVTLSYNIFSDKVITIGSFSYEDILWGSIFAIGALASIIRAFECVIRSDSIKYAFEYIKKYPANK